MSLLILACCVFLISSVSAADINDGLSTAQDEDSIHLNNITYSGEGQLDVANDNAIIKTTVNIELVNKNIQTEKIVLSEINLDTANLIKIFGTPDQFVAFLSLDDGTPVTGESIIFTISGKNYTKITDEDGKVALNINLGVGTYDITTTYGDIINYNTIKVINHIVSQDIVKAYKNGTQYTVLVLNDDLTPKADAIVDISLNGKTYQKTTDENGIATLNINLNPGEYSITSSYNGESITNTVTVIWGELHTQNLTKYVQTSDKFVAIVTDVNNNPTPGVSVDIIINGKTYQKTTDENGTASLNINLGPGTYYITTIYGDKTAENKITVLNADLKTSDLVKYSDESKAFVAKVTGSKPVEGATVYFTINGVTYQKTTDANGEAKLNINLGPGLYDITTTYSDKKATNQIYIFGIGLTTNDLTKYYKDGKPFIAKVSGSKPVEGATVYFTINGVTYQKTTDENGEAKLNINLGAGVYQITTKYDTQTKTNKVTILNGVIIAEDMEKYYKDPTPYSVLVVDGDAKPLKDISVDFKIEGETYTVLSDENGIAKIAVDYMPGKYSVTTTCGPYNVTKLITIISPDVKTQDLVKYYKNDSQFEATVMDGNKTVANATVTFIINGKSYNRITDENGEATININLAPGNYIIITQYGEEQIRNTITVLPTIIVKDTEVTFKEGEKFNATLLDGQGKPLINTTFSFIINEKSYERVTDENGTGYITINLNPGVYTIGTCYNGETVYSKLTVKKRTADIKIASSTVKQNDKLQVTITDKKTGEPISNAIVYYIVYYDASADPIVAAQYTNAEGISRVTIGLPTGSYQMMVGLQNDPFYQNMMLYTTLTVV